MGEERSKLYPSPPKGLSAVASFAKASDAPTKEEHLNWCTRRRSI
jgi:hypothetical protein